MKPSNQGHVLHQMTFEYARISQILCSKTIFSSKRKKQQYIPISLMTTDFPKVSLRNLSNVLGQIMQLGNIQYVKHLSLCVAFGYFCRAHG